MRAARAWLASHDRRSVPPAVPTVALFRRRLVSTHRHARRFAEPRAPRRCACPSIVRRASCCAGRCVGPVCGVAGGRRPRRAGRPRLGAPPAADPGCAPVLPRAARRAAGRRVSAEDSRARSPRPGRAGAGDLDPVLRPLPRHGRFFPAASGSHHARMGLLSRRQPERRGYRPERRARLRAGRPPCRAGGSNHERSVLLPARSRLRRCAATLPAG